MFNYKVLECLIINLSLINDLLSDLFNAKYFINLICCCLSETKIISFYHFINIYYLYVVYLKQKLFHFIIYKHLLFKWLEIPKIKLVQLLH
jgi:hypothetical protein